MTWATAGNLTTENLNSGSDSPAAARTEIKAAIDELTNVANGLNTAGGAAKLDATTTKVIANLGIQSTQDLILTPGSGYSVNIQDVLNLNPKTTAELEALTSAEGDIAYCSDGDTGSKCFAVYNGTNWLRISLGTAIASS